MAKRLRIAPGGVASLKKIARLPLKCSKRKFLVKSLDSKVIKKLSEVTNNLLKGKINLRPNQLRRLKKHKRVLRKFKNKSLALKSKRALIQRGGFIAPLLSIALPVLSSLLHLKQ